MTNQASRPRWECDEGRNILSPTNLEILGSAFHGSPNIAFGFHYWYAGGQGHTNFASRGTFDILEEIEHSRPGDHFTIFSLRDIAGLAEASIQLNEQSLDRLFGVLRDVSANTEIAVVLDTSTPSVHVVWNLDDRDIADLCKPFQAAGAGTAFLFRMSVLDLAEDGSVLNSVTPRPGCCRVHALLDAKRPAPDGSTPSTGPY